MDEGELLFTQQDSIYVELSFIDALQYSVPWGGNKGHGGVPIKLYLQKQTEGRTCLWAACPSLFQREFSLIICSSSLPHEPITDI